MRLISWIVGFFPKRAPRPTSFRYKYQRHPFDDWQYFSVSAHDKAEADTLALVHFQKLFDERVTVMTFCVPDYK